MMRTHYIAKDSSVQEWLDRADAAYRKADPVLNPYVSRDVLVTALMAAWDFIGEVPDAQEKAPAAYRKADNAFLSADPGTNPTASEDVILNAVLDAWDLIEALTTQRTIAA